VSPQPRLWIGDLLRSATQRLRGRTQSEEAALLKAALQRHVSAVTTAKSREEALESLGSLLETTFALAAAQGISRAEIEPKPVPTGNTRRVLRHVSQLRSSVARVARDGSMRVVTQRFLGVRGTSIIRLRSFTRLIPANLAYVPAPAHQSLRTYESAPFSDSTALAFPMRVPLATRKELAAWAVSATSQLVVERLLIPYLRRLAEKHIANRSAAASAALFGELGSLVVPIGLRLLAMNASRES
jgi:hypothetical protein